MVVTALTFVDWKLSTAFNSWTELHLNRRQLWSFGRELPSAEIIGKKRWMYGNTDCRRQFRSRNQGCEISPRIKCSNLRFKYSATVAIQKTLCLVRISAACRPDRLRSTRHDVRGTSGDDAPGAMLMSRFVIRVRRP